MEQEKIDPELSRQLDQAALTNSPVQAVLKLRPLQETQLVASPEHTAELANQVIKRVSDKLGEQANRMTLFRNLGSFAIDAQPKFLRELLDQPEIAAASANRQPGSAYIAPINPRPVEINEVGHERQPGNKKVAARRKH
jgi:hypothetical protein